MTHEQSSVKGFMQKFGQKTPDKPTMPDLATRILRCKLILEEALEFCCACGIIALVSPPYASEPSTLDITSIDFELSNLRSSDLTAYADATADLRVVVCGADVAAGIDGEPIFNIVHASNMSKLWTMDEVASITPDSGLRVVAVDRENPSAGYIVTNESSKVIKSPSYLSAIEGIAIELERQKL